MERQARDYQGKILGRPVHSYSSQPIYNYKSPFETRNDVTECHRTQLPGGRYFQEYWPASGEGQ